MRTREQERAQLAHAKVQGMERDPLKKEYGQICLDLPFLILKNGLCQTVAYYEAKTVKKPQYGLLLEHLASVCEEKKPLATASGERKPYSERVRNAEVAEYQRMTHEALACAQWFKRYAEAVLKAEPGDQGAQR